MKQKIFLNELAENFNSVFDDKKNKLLNISDEKFNYKISPNKWSIAQIIEHLVISNNLYLPRIKNAMEKKEKSENENTEFRNSLLGKIIFATMKPESKITFKAPKIFLPSQNNLEKSIVEKYLSQKKEIITAINEAGSFNISKIKVSSPATKLLRLNLGEILLLTYIHNKRHAIQIENILNSFK